MQILFRFIETGTAAYENMVALRMNVLLSPIGIPRSFINQQQEREDVLIGAYEENGKLIGCCILTRMDAQVVQLRQMAVGTHFQGKGVGASILSFAEELARNKGYERLIMHARDRVASFYEKCGYEIFGERFLEVGIGHYKMQKRLVSDGHKNQPLLNV